MRESGLSVAQPAYQFAQVVYYLIAILIIIMIDCGDRIAAFNYNSDLFVVSHENGSFYAENIMTLDQDIVFLYWLKRNVF